MNQAMKTTFSLALVLLALLSSRIGAAQAPASQKVPSRVPLTIVLTRDLPSAAPGALYVLKRRPRGEQHDVLLVREAVTSAQLSEAIWAVITIRQIDGDTASRVVTVRPSATRARTARQELPWVARVLADLRQTEPRPVAGVGNRKAIEIWLPPQRRRTTQGS